MRTADLLPSPPRPPSHHRLIDLEVIEWFRQRGWRATPTTEARPRAFVDEAHLAGVTIRRVWHTPLAARRLAPARENIWLQVDGTLNLVDSSGTQTTLTPYGLALWSAFGVSAWSVNAPSARIEIERARERSPSHTKSSLVVPGTERQGIAWACLAGSVNMLLNSEEPLDDTSSRLLSLAIESMADAAIGPLSRGPTSGRGDEKTPGLARARRLLHEKASDATYSVERAAQDLGMTRSHLTRMFRANGDTPRNVLRAERTAIARRLLAADETADPAVVARRAGFPSSRAMKDAFRRSESPIGLDAGDQQTAITDV